MMNLQSQTTISPLALLPRDLQHATILPLPFSAKKSSILDAENPPVEKHTAPNKIRRKPAVYNGPTTPRRKPTTPKFLSTNGTRKSAVLHRNTTHKRKPSTNKLPPSNLSVTETNTTPAGNLQSIRPGPTPLRKSTTPKQFSTPCDTPETYILTS